MLPINGEWYHCYNRGTDKRKVFLDSKDYERFVMLLYISNGSNPIWISNKHNPNLYSLLQDQSLKRGEAFVDIGAYALMPNHVHFVIRQRLEKGLPRFMQKLFTGYTMYFNLKYNRTGALFAGTYKAKQITTDAYLKLAVPYVLLNPIELFEPQWKSGLGKIEQVEKSIRSYRFSSLLDFLGETRPENKIVNGIDAYYEPKPTLGAMLINALSYYEQSPEV